MAITAFIKQLMLLIGSCILINATPNEITKCEQISTCNCTYYKGYKIQCPSYNPEISVTTDGNSVVISCTEADANRNVYLVLPNMELGNMERVKFTQCPLPIHPILTILKHLGIRKTQELNFLSNDALLVRQHLRGFTELQRLNGNGFANLHENLFDDMENLTWLKLNSKLNHLPVNIFRNLMKLEYIELSNSNIKNLEPGLFQSQQSLKRLHLRGNSLENVSKGVFEGASNILELDLSLNNIEQLQEDVFIYLTNLSTINLSSNRLTSVPPGLFTFNLNIRNLSLASNKLTDSLPRNLFINLSNILYLDLSHNELTELDEDLFATTRSLEVLDLSHNKIKNLSNAIFRNLRNIKKNILDSMFINSQAIASIRNSLPIKQNQKNNLSYVNSTRNDIKHCPEPCNCQVRTVDKTLIVNCSNANLSDAPNLPNPTKFGLEFIELYIENNAITALPSKTNQSEYNYVTKIYANHNRIDRLLPENIPDNLSTLELAYNHLKWFDSRILQELYKFKITLHLGHNPWICDCNAKIFLRYIQLHLIEITDVVDIRCSDQQQLNELEISNLCSDYQFFVISIAITILLALLCILATLAALYYKYQEEVQVWMYAHNWCLSSDENLAKDKIYDAFISHTHKDADFIIEEIIQYLENSPHQYKLCLHNRDWIPGGYIQDSIIHSVEDSRRTIIVLMSNRSVSIWTKLALQMAHANTMSERRPGAIIVLHGDIVDKEAVGPKLKLYLKTNTYLKWDDPLFWKKLSNTMVAPKINKRKRNTKIATSSC